MVNDSTPPTTVGRENGNEIRKMIASNQHCTIVEDVTSSTIDTSTDDYELQNFYRGVLGSHNKELVIQIEDMLENLEPPPSSQRCIWRVPEKIRNLNEQAYSPRVISIGPFHHKISERLISMDATKIRYFQNLIARSNISLWKYVQMVKGLEEKARECYAEPIGMSSNTFVTMLLIDACFIIELLFRAYHAHMDEDDGFPLSTPWLRSDIRLDLMLLENQIPFFVLDKIFVLAKPSLDVNSLKSLALRYFQKYNMKNIDENCGSLVHFTDLILIMSRPNSPRPQPTHKNSRNIYSATKLRESGVMFQASTNKCLLDIMFKKGVLTIPYFKLDDHTEIFIRNLMALELCLFPNYSYIIDYILFMDYLVDTSSDIDLLTKRGIIENGLGESNVAADLFNNLCKNITVDHANFYFSGICEDLNAYYRKPMHKWKAIFKRDYFSTPWKTASTIAATVFLALTLIQTICSIISLFISLY